jgi:hypothetical protein
METDWKSFCSGHAFKVEGNRIHVAAEKGRQQTIEVSATDEVLHLHSVVARAAAVARFDDAVMRAWLRNRAVSLVAFRIDERGRMIGESWVSIVGLTTDEFRLYLQTLAFECDRFEHQLTGSDIE